MNLTPHFTLEELTYSSKAATLKIDNTPSKDIVENLKALAVALEMIRSVLGKPLKISSAYRCPALNAVVKGSKTSAHVFGLAADFTVDGLTPRQVCEKIIAAGIPHDQIIMENISSVNPDGTWVHFGISRGTMRNQVLTMKAGKYYTGLIK